MKASSYFSSDGNLTGGWGAGFVALIVMLFAFSSIVANYVYAENNLIFCVLDSSASSGSCESLP
jgi:AGCS family alanine or glycine:cation symporter